MGHSGVWSNPPLSPRQRRELRFEEIVTKYDQGWSPGQIADHVEVHISTVYRYLDRLNAEAFKDDAATSKILCSGPASEANENRRGLVRNTERPAPHLTSRRRP